MDTGYAYEGGKPCTPAGVPIAGPPVGDTADEVLVVAGEALGAAGETAEGACGGIGKRDAKRVSKACRN